MQISGYGPTDAHYVDPENDPLLWMKNGLRNVFLVKPKSSIGALDAGVYRRRLHADLCFLTAARRIARRLAPRET